ncbi:hypothetical protein J3R82DRAFT_6898, partial [Butyriboletus roseoflavus]
NYLTWHIQMHALLICSNLWGIMLGIDTMPDPATATPTTVNTFALHKLKATAKITLYINNSQIIHVQGDNPKAI